MHTHTMQLLLYCSSSCIVCVCVCVCVCDFVSVHRNEDLQEQLWTISMKDVKEYLSPETWHRYSATTQTPRAGSLHRTGRHSFRSNRHKPEDCEKLIGGSQESMQEAEDSNTVGESEGEEGEGRKWQRHSMCV